MGEAELSSGFKLIGMIWGVVFISIAPYIAICHVVGLEATQSIEGVDALRDGFAVLAGGLVVLTYALRRRYFRLKWLVGRVTQPDQGPHAQALQLYRVVMIVSIAILETVSILGLVLFFLGAGFMVLYGFLGLAALGMIYLRPRYRELLSLADYLSKQPMET